MKLILIKDNFKIKKTDTIHSIKNIRYFSVETDSDKLYKNLTIRISKY